MNIAKTLGSVAFGLYLSGCAAFQKAEVYLPSGDQIACVINETATNAKPDPLAVVVKCGIDQSALAFVEHLIMGTQSSKPGMAAMAAAKAGAAK